MLGLADLLLKDGLISSAAADDFADRALNPLAPRNLAFPGDGPSA